MNDDDFVRMETFGSLIIYRDKNSLAHRTSGPAIKDLYYESYLIHGKKHRIDGPSYNNKRWKVKEWWINGRRLLFHETKRLKKYNKLSKEELLYYIDDWIAKEVFKFKEGL